MKLLPCPFCGVRPEYMVTKIMTTMHCCNDKCPAETVYVQRATKKIAFKSWNTRSVSTLATVSGKMAEALKFAYECMVTQPKFRVKNRTSKDSCDIIEQALSAYQEAKSKGV